MIFFVNIKWAQPLLSAVKNYKARHTDYYSKKTQVVAAMKCEIFAD